jgi:hypothetical protein
MDLRGNELARLLGEIKIAPDSNSDIGLPPPVGSGSTIAGMRLLGEIARNSGLNWSPLPMFTGTIR